MCVCLLRLNDCVTEFLLSLHFISQIIIKWAQMFGHFLPVFQKNQLDSSASLIVISTCCLAMYAREGVRFTSTLID